MAAFASPPAAYAPLLIWIWDGGLEAETLRANIRQAASAGFGGLITRVGYASSTSYLSDEWLQILRFCARECGEAGLQLWIGDEGPGRAGTLCGDGSGSGRSGTQAGRIARQWPELHSHHLRFQIDEVAHGHAAVYQLPPTSGPLLHAIAAPLDAATRKVDFSRSITLNDKEPERLGFFLERLKADVRVMLFSQESGGYVDLLNPRVAEQFLQGTHQRIRDALGDDWASVAGFWLQSPTLRDSGSELQSLAWSPLLLQSFTGQPGYELLEWLPALVAELGDDASRLRQDFWQTISRMSGQSFWRPLSDWATTNGVAYAGAAASHDPLNSIVANHGDVAPIYRALSHPTVQAPGLSNNSGLDLGRHLGARLAASVAALKTPPAQEARSVAEVWRGAAWSATLSERLPSLHHLLRQGISSFAVHGTPLHTRDDKPWSQPPGELLQPYVARWPGFAAYVARCSYLMSRGRPGARVGLLWPIRSAQAHHHPKGHRLTRWVEEDLYATALMLDDLHFNFLFVEENDLLEAPIQDAKVLCGAARHPFELIVLPSVTTLPRALWDKLERFVLEGGKVACLGLLPRYSEVGRDTQFEERIGKATMVTVGDLYEAYSEMENSGGSAPPTLGFAITKEGENGGRWSCYQPRLNDDVRDALLRVRKILKESLTPELETQSTDLLYSSRVLANDESPLDWGEIVTPEAIEDEPPAGEAALIEQEAPLEPIEDAGFDWDQPFDWEEDNTRASTLNGTAVNDAAEMPAQSTLSGDEANQTAAQDSETEPEASEMLTLLSLDEALPEAPAAGGDLFFVFNAADQTQRVNVRLRPTRDGVPHLLDAWSGELRRLPIWTQFPELEGGGLSLSLELAAYEARWLWVQPFAKPSDEERAHVEAATWTVEDFNGDVARGYATENGVPRLAVRSGGRLDRSIGEEIELPAPLLLPDNWQTTRLGPNAAPTPEWQWQRGRHLPGDSRRLFGRDTWQILTRPSIPATAERSVEAPPLRLDLSGIITFRTDFEIAEIPSELWLPFEPLDVPRDVYLNGELLESGAPTWKDMPPWNDRSWQWLDLSEFATAGQNVLSIVADCRERSGGDGGFAPGEEPLIAQIPARPRLVGDFSLTSDGALMPAAALSIEAGSWHDQGLPFYSGALDYRQWVKAPTDWNRCRIFLEVSRTRDVCGLWLNGRFIGERFTAPYRFDVSKQLLKGASNEVRLRLWNTAEAARDLPAQPSPSGLLGPVRLVAYPLVYQTL